jgi:hypothetical protein
MWCSSTWSLLLKTASEDFMDSLSRWEVKRSMVFFRLVSPHKNIYNQLYGRAFALEEFIKCNSPLTWCCSAWFLHVNMSYMTSMVAFLPWEIKKSWINAAWCSSACPKWMI